MGTRARGALPWVILLIWGCGAAIIAAPAEPVDPAASADIESTLFLIGDAGGPAPDEPVLKALRQAAASDSSQKVIVFLGDNVYPRGMPPASNPGRAEAERRLREQMAVGLDTRTPTYFVPGNHDWGYMGPDGWQSIQRQGEFIREHGQRLVQLLPQHGCPGPEIVDVGRRARLIMLDTQWFVHEYTKPADSTAGCATWTTTQVADSLSRAIASAAPRDSLKDEIAHIEDVRPPESERIADSLRRVVDTMVDRSVFVLAHHPMETTGEHGGHFSWIDQIFPLRRLASWLWIPLPGVGSTEAVARRAGQTNQDMTGPLYTRMRNTFDGVFEQHPALVFAGGHDHNLQVLRGIHVKWILVNGAGIFGHMSPVGFTTSTRYAAAASGFMRLDVLRNGRVRLGVITVNAAGEGKESFALVLE